MRVLLRRGKRWSMCLFSSANAIRQYRVGRLVELAVRVWVGVGSARDGEVGQAVAHGAPTAASSRGTRRCLAHHCPPGCRRRNGCSKTSTSGTFTATFVERRN